MPSSKRSLSISSNGQPLIIGTELKYTLKTNVPRPYEVRWQVVNTGRDARIAGGLRGSFFRGKTLTGSETFDEHVNYESTAYVGSHWIQGFVIKDGNLVARTEPFTIRLLPKKRGFRLIRS